MSRKPHLIGIAGPSGAGKTFLAEHLVRELKDAVILPIDAYYPDLGHISFDERNQLNFDDPAIIDSPLLFEHVGTLARGEPIAQPVYDFSRHTRTPKTIAVPAAPFVIIEGLFTLYWPELRTLLNTGVYVEMKDAVCLKRRIARDVHERGRSPEHVEEQFRTTVVPSADLFVKPTAQFADVVVHGGSAIEQEIADVLAHLKRSV
jgi:uridine kinase